MPPVPANNCDSSSTKLPEIPLVVRSVEIPWSNTACPPDIQSWSFARSCRFRSWAEMPRDTRFRLRIRARRRCSSNINIAGLVAGESSGACMETNGEGAGAAGRQAQASGLLSFVNLANHMHTWTRSHGTEHVSICASLLPLHYCCSPR